MLERFFAHSRYAYRQYLYGLLAIFLMANNGVDAQTIDANILPKTAMPNAASSPNTPISVTDQRGVRVVFAQPPQRIVSLLPSLTESVCALGQCARLVGTDRYSNYPPSVQALPRVGGGIDPSIEAVVALKPDVVLMSMSSRATARFESLGIKVLAFEPVSHADVHTMLDKLGVLLGVPTERGAAVLWRDIEAGMQAAAQSITPAARRQKVYFEINRGPYGAGESSFIGETLRRLGVGNIVPPALGTFPKLNPEFILRAQPDLIILSQRSLMADTPYPGWQALTAVRQQRLCHFDEKMGDVLVRSGPRMAEAARWLAQCVNQHAAGRAP
jgi:iron complex transport system substrate-binding protein